MPQALPPGISIASFSEGYRKYFEVVPATTNALKWHNYHLRHEVYARELGWQPCRPDELETDDYDRHSLHCLVRAVTSHRFVGGARLVLPDPPAPERPLPFEAACGDALDRAVIGRLDRHRIGEISRLAVIARYRRRPGEADRAFAIDDDFGIAPRIRLPYLTLGLYLALVALARTRGIGTLFMLTEPELARRFAHLGIELTPVGASIDQHGEHVPSMMNIDAILAGMASYVRPFFDTITDDIERALRAPA